MACDALATKRSAGNSFTASHLLVTAEIDANASREFQEDAGVVSEVAQVTARWMEGLVGGESSVCEEVYALLDPSFDRQVPHHPASVSTAGGQGWVSCRVILVDQSVEYCFFYEMKRHLDHEI